MAKDDPDIVRRAGQHVFELFQKANVDAPLIYHGYKRSRELVDTCREIAKAIVPLASKDHLEEAELLRLEEEGRTGKRYSDVEWTQSRIDYLQKHAYRTRWAQLEYDGQRAKSIVRLHKVLRKQLAQASEHRADEAKAAKTIERRRERSPDDYLERMNALLADAAALQKAMIDYLYFGRTMLLRRRKTLQLTYDIFIHGLAIALVFFAVAIIRR